MKKILNLLLLLCIALAGAAQKQLNAEQVLSRTAGKLYEAPAVNVKFRATAGDTAVDGDMTICREKFKMLTADYTVWYNGTQMWNYYKKNSEAYLSVPTLEELLEINPFIIVSHYKNNYAAKVISHQGGKYTLQIEPINRTSQIKQATLVINSADWLPASVSVTFANEAQAKISILSATIGTSVPPVSTFSYSAKDYPTVELIDLR